MGPRSLITGSSTWKTRADFLSQSLLHQSERTNISQAALLWKMKKVKIGRAAAPPNRKLSKRGPACECRSVHAVGVSKACQLWVKSGHLQCKKVCPLYPQKRTFAPAIRMSALGHKRTHALQQNSVAIRSLGVGWRISSSEGYRNAHQGGADSYHCKAHCPWPKPCMTRKNDSTKK